MTATASRWTPLVGPMVVVGVTYLYFFAGSYYGIYDVRVRIASLVIVAVVLALFALAAWRSDRWLPRSAIWPALALGVGALAIAAVFSRNPRISLDFVAYGVLLAALYLLLRALLADGPMRARLGVAIVILAFAIDVAYLVAVGGWWRTWWEVLGRMAVPPLRPFFEGLTYGNPGMVAALAVLTSLCATAQLGFGGRRARVAVVGLWALTTVVVVVTGTRGAWVALALTAVVAAGLALLAWRSGSARARAVDRRALLVVGGVAVVGGLVLLAWVGPLVVDRLLNGSDGGRVVYWVAALRMFAAAPLTGVGPGMWAPERITYTQEGELDYYIPHAHNVYLQTASELGLLGLVAGLVALVVVVRLVWPAFRDAHPARRRWAVGALLASVYFGSHQLFDVLINMPAALFVFAFPIAWLDATMPAREGAGGGTATARGRGRWALGIGLVAVGLAVGWSLAGERSALLVNGAKSALDAGDWSRADAQASEAVAIDRSIPANQLLLALASARVDDPASSSAALGAVVGADGLPAAWLDIAWLRTVDGDADGARAALREGLRLGQQSPAINLAAGAVEETLGDAAGADSAWVLALQQLPRLAADPFWRDGARAERWPTTLARAADGLVPERRVDLYLSADDPDAARSAAGAVPDSALRERLGLVIDAWTGDEQARSTLEAQAYADPRDLPLLAWCARLADRFGDADAADVFRYLADMQSPSAGQEGTEVRVVTDVRPPDAMAGANWLTYGIYTYRRPTPGALLLPGLPQVVYASS